jgi:hypothetical protein
MNQKIKKLYNKKKKKNLLHSLGLVLQIYEGHDDQLNRPGPMA